MLIRFAHAARVSVAFALLLSFPTHIFAWGREGHHIIALLVESRLNESAKARIAELLGQETLTAASVWPDEIRNDHRETAGWHYVSIPRSAPFYDEARDCYKPDPSSKETQTDRANCAVARIDLYARILADSSQTKTAQVEALKYLVHFASDLHQPMHAMDTGRGGNDIKIVEFGHPMCGPDRQCNLHGLWDTGLIEHSESDEGAYTHRLEALIAQDHMDRIPEGRPADWANESHVLAEGALLQNGGLADQVYFNHEISVVDRRLALAGIRIARMLNSIFGESGSNGKPARSASVTSH